MEKTIRRLKFFYFLPITISLLLVLCFETELLVAGGLCLRWGEQGEFIVTTVMELLTICLIPIALRLFKTRKIKQSLASSPENLLRYGSVRLALIMLPLMMNTLFYYLFLAVPFGYLAIILLLTSAFIYPSTSRCNNETAINTIEK